MIKYTLNYICCPQCKSDFKEKGGFLVCKNCGEKYEIIEEIPVLVNLKSLGRHHRKQVLYFEKESKAKISYVLEEWQKSYMRRFESSISVSDNDVVADIGTGGGYMAIELAKRGNTVLACDLNLKGLVRLKRISERLDLTKNLILFACAAEQLPVKTNLVGIFILNAVLEHLPKEEAAIKEMGRICRKKAYGFVTVPLKLKYIWPFFWPMNIVHDKRLGHLRRYDRKNLQAKFGRYDFKIKNVFYTGHFLKAIGVLVQTVFKTHKFDKWLEDIDRKGETRKYGANNIIIVLERDVEWFRL